MPLSCLFRVYKASSTLTCLVLCELYPAGTDNPMVEMGAGHVLERGLMNDVTLDHEPGVKKESPSF